MVSVTAHNAVMSPGILSDGKRPSHDGLISHGIPIDSTQKNQAKSKDPVAEKPEESDPSDTGDDFEFRLGYTAAKILPADELFSDGKLLPVYISTTSLPSPKKAPICVNRLEEILGLRKLHLNSGSPAPLSSSSSQLNKTDLNHVSTVKRSPQSRSKIRRASESCILADSPRMNSSGKIVFHTLERSSSSPSSLNGNKLRGTERPPYSSNLRVAPVLNVPVCSIRSSSKSSMFSFPTLFSSQKKSQNRNTNKMQPKESCN